MLAKAEQLEKPFSPIEVMVSAKITVVNLEQFLKASLLIPFKLFCKVILVMVLSLKPLIYRTGMSW
jgi:hypothetical protein